MTGSLARRGHLNHFLVYRLSKGEAIKGSMNTMVMPTQSEERTAKNEAPLGKEIPVRVQVRPFEFKDFGVLDTGRQSKRSTATAVVLNLLLLAFAVLLGTVAKRTIEENRRVAVLVTPVMIKPVEPPPPPKIMPRPLPPTPVVMKTEPPKIKLPDVKLPDVPKPAEVKMTQPAPVIAPAAPKKITAPPAPQAVHLEQLASSVPNSSQRPSPIALGSAPNPIAPSNRPATSAVNLGQHGAPQMNASNNSSGPASTKVSLGSGNPDSQTMAGNGSRPVQGVKLGVNGGTGPMNATGRVAGQVNLGQYQQPAVKTPAALVAVKESAPKVLFKPTPAYTPEATALHVSGAVAIKIRVSATGSVTVLAITSPLGHGLDQSAERAIEGTRFSPAVDASGRPVDWEGVVRVNFQLAS